MKFFHLSPKTSVILTFFIVSGTLPIKVFSNALIDNPKSLLWKITSSDKPQLQPSYLFGTIHTVCPQDYFEDSTFINLLKSSEQLITEIDFSQLAKKAKSLAALPSYYSQEDYDLISKFFTDTLGLTLSDYDDTHPLILANQITLNGLPCSFKSLGSYDEKIASLFEIHSTSKVYSGLETIAFQLDLLKFDSLQLWADNLLESVKNYNVEREALLDLYNAYFDQDLDSIGKMVFSDSISSEDSLEMKEFLDDRNLDWMTQIPTLIETYPSFIAVGAAHLVGSNGLLNLLEQAGYTLTPIPLSPKNISIFYSKKSVLKTGIGVTPNPFRGATTIRFQANSPPRIRIYDLNGHLIRSWSPTIGSVTWNGQDLHGRDVASGTYIVRVDTGERVMSKRIVLMR